MAANDTNAPAPPDWFSQILAVGSAGTSGSPLDAILQTALMGASGRQGLTSQPLVGIMPKWITSSPQISQAVTAGTLDPYLPSNDPQSWQVFGTRGADHAPISAKTADMRDAHDMAPDVAKTGDSTSTVSAVSNQPYLWSESQIKDAIDKFQKAGLSNVTDFETMQKAWAGLTQMAGARYSLSSGKIKVTPWDMLDLYKKTNIGSGGGSGGFTGTHSQTQKTVSEISQGDAWSALRQTTSQMLGHDPSDQEVRDFAYRMNSLAAQNPTISKTTGNYQDGMLTNSSTKTSGGFTANDVQHAAYDNAQNNPDYAEFQAATTLYNAALSAMGEIGG